MGTLHWIDCLHDRVVPATLTRPALGLVERAAGGLVLVAGDGISFLDPGSGASRPVSPLRGNDGKCDRQGRLWVGSDASGGGRLYRIDPDLRLAVVDEGFRIPNGPASARTVARCISRTRPLGSCISYGIDPTTGAAEGRHVFARVPPGLADPDGMTVDAQGCLWSSHRDGGRLTRYDPSGAVERVLRLPVPKVTSYAFGGADLAQLYVANSLDRWSLEVEDAESDLAPACEAVPGGLYRLDPGVRGLPDTPFAG